MLYQTRPKELIRRTKMGETYLKNLGIFARLLSISKLFESFSLYIHEGIQSVRKPGLSPGVISIIRVERLAGGAIL